MKLAAQWERLSQAVTPWRIFGGGFLYVLTFGLLLQKIILPLTPWHAGNGLLDGGDWVRFHAAAVQLAQLIEEGGWAHWELRPDGNAPIGIAAALYAMTGLHAPWVVLPVNGILFGLAAAFLWRIASTLCRNPSSALMLILPMFFFPSAVMIWGQIHKDVWVLAGTMVLAFGLLQVGNRAGFHDFYRLVLWPSIGMVLIWVVRPYAMAVFVAASIMGVMAILWLFKPRAGLWSRAGVFLISQVTVVHFLTVGPVSGPACDVWRQSPPVPLVDRQLAGIACAREGFRLSYPSAGSNIDTDVSFQTAKDIAVYLPRATEIVLFAPFPNSWVARNEAKMPGGALQRLLVIPEMLVYYLALGGCVWAVAMAPRRERAIVAALTTYAFFCALTYGLVVTNVGTLYRMRYPFMLLLCALGLWGVANMRRRR